MVTSTKPLTDEDLVKKIKRGSQEALLEIMGRYHSRASSLAYRITRNQEDTEEVIQDAFLSVFRKIKTFEGKSSFSSWLYRIVSNAALMKVRKNKQKPTLYLEDFDPHTQQRLLEKEFERDPYRRNETRKAVRELILFVPELNRDQLRLAYLEEMQAKEAGALCGISEYAAKSRLHRGKVLLKKQCIKAGVLYEAA